MSVQCFDLQIVKKAIYLEALLIDNHTKQKELGIEALL